MTVEVLYEGNLHTEATHIQSGTKITTDAPKDNHGKGESFSPTDMVASALASCMLTVIGIKASSMGIELKGTKAEVTKIMNAEPRRLREIQVTLYFPPLNLDEKQKTILERVACTCPVGASLSPEVVQTIKFNW